MTFNALLLSFFLAATPALAQTTPGTISRADLEEAITQLYTLFPVRELVSAENVAELPFWMVPSSVESVPPQNIPAIFEFGAAFDTPATTESANTDAYYLAAFMADLDTTTYNDLITHALMDYRHHPEHREALASFLGSLSQHARSRIDTARLHQRAPYLAALDQVVTAVEWAYTFAFGAGVWSAGREVVALSRAGRTMSGTEQFAHLLRGGMRNMRMPQPMLIGLGMGATNAAIQAYLLRGFENIPLDPLPLLRQTDAELARRLAERTVAFRDRACAFSPHHRLSFAEAQSLRTEIYAIFADRNFLAVCAPHTLHTLRGTDDPRHAALVCLNALDAEAMPSTLLP